MTSATSQRPLEGFRVLEICHMLAGPYCGMLLADLGAEVIKIEAGEGDISRQTGPHHLGPHNIYFSSLNRNKKSVLVDLKVPEGRAQFEALVRQSDAIVTNLRPEVIERLGLTYDQLSGLNPKLVCVALTGFGLTGPFRDFPAYDYIIQALCGVMMLTGEPGAPPVRAGYSVVDNTGGMMATVALLAQLLSGRGGQVDIALYDVMLSQLNYLAAAYLNAGAEPERHPSGGHAYFVPAQIFETADGYIALFVTHDRFWAEFCRSVDRPDWIVDERFATMKARMQNRSFVIGEIQALLKQRGSDDWMDRLVPRGVVAAGVRTVAASLSCEQTVARDMVVTVNTPHGPLRMMGNPIKIQGAQTCFSAPPLLGEHDAGDLARSRA